MSSQQPSQPQKRNPRRYSRLDQWFKHLDHARLTLSDALPQHRPRPQPSAYSAEAATAGKPATTGNTPPLSESESAEIAGCLRVNHTGEVCAQALYLGQATQAESEAVRSHLLESAAEEEAHLQWCAERLGELDAKPSRLNPLWYLLSFGLGATVAKLSDRISLGFIHATENQVKHHLEEHIAQIPAKDTETLAILNQMLIEENEHADAALAKGGQAFPRWVQSVMWATSRVMTTASRRF